MRRSLTHRHTSCHNATSASGVSRSISRCRSARISWISSGAGGVSIARAYHGQPSRTHGVDSQSGAPWRLPPPRLFCVSVYLLQLREAP